MLVVDSVVDLDVNILGVVIIFDGVVISTTVPYFYIKLLFILNLDKKY